MPTKERLLGFLQSSLLTTQEERGHCFTTVSNGILLLKKGVKVSGNEQ
jgi:hypothetical protein